jgi:hypothetical protein
VSLLNSPIELIASEVARSRPVAVLLWAALRALPMDVRAAAEVDSTVPRYVRANTSPAPCEEVSASSASAATTTPTRPLPPPPPALTGRAAAQRQRAAAYRLPPIWTGLGKARRLAASLLCLMVALCPAASVVTPGAAAAAPYAPSLHGKVVKFGLSGFEPDFDPIYRVIISATLHDGRKGGLPDAMLVLSAYLENFQPDTTPVLPDLLHPDQTATSLGGFLTGKAALVNAAGHIVYRGSLLAETFLDNSAHVVLDLDDVKAPATGSPALRLRGVFTLRKDLTLRGWLRAVGRPALPALAAPRAPAPSWQSVERGLSVSVPRMMGTAGHSQYAPQAARPTRRL